MQYKLIILVYFLFSFVSCKKENMCDCVKSSGTHIATYRDISNFNCVVVSEQIEVYLTQGNEYEVRVEAGKNLQSLIKTELSGDTLKVSNHNRCNWVRGYNEAIRVYITAPYFKYVLNNGIGPLVSTNTITQDLLTCRAGNSGSINLKLNTGIIRASAHGNGDIYLSGVTSSLENDYRGTNYLYASDLTVTNYIYLHSLTIGKTFVNAPENGLMDIVIEQSGNIYYTGNPATIHLTKNSTGDLIHQ